ncbi:MAG: ABC transporter ATP-binding protein [Candidatus Dormibacteraeota bacterium]|uniref:ABC transporter ATP-binding protein n=1 Tax=Candidatus Amunia macphersoniae TaxID=3127014 RepID=A0A934KPW7_9BACT|nr:ABC transporter ATP-binding protein [Candidatus Dormibacteraeota bacterium]
MTVTPLIHPGAPFSDASAASDASDASAAPGDAITLTAVSKSFGAVHAVDDLTLRVRQGESVALLGPNGAGKSTTISMLLGLAAPDRGRVELFGADPAAAVASGRVGAMLQEGGLMRGVRIRELLEMLGSLYPSPMTVERACSLAQLEGLENRLVDRLSGGQTQRLRVAVALVGNPELLVLDEPTAAMDVEARRTFWKDMDEQAASGRTILFSTHYLDEADEHCDRVVVIGGGRLLADGTPASIKASVGLRALRFSVNGGTNGFDRLPSVRSVEVRGRRVELLCSDTDAAVRELVSQRSDAYDIEVTGVGLEDAFVALTNPARAA